MPRNANKYSRASRSEKDQVFLYGTHTVMAALANPDRNIFSLYATGNASAMIAAAAANRGLKPEILRPVEISKRAPAGAVHQGVLAVAAPLSPADLKEMDLDGPVVVLDRVTDPHNVGAIIRTAAAFGASSLVTTRLFTPEATGVLAKAASGGLEHVPWARETNLARAIECLKDRGHEVVGLDGSAETNLRAVANSTRIALVLGAEDKGLRRKTAAICDRLARIPLPGAIVSLNVSNAAAAALAIATGLDRT